ncbi:MAG TPA: Gfo/Idh/MocA family oxidoreductase, partial [Candidatus Hodarchaeales archaeon]|nr:Gfo/Idh/MocA family oxidoreductase [Candidatus Hodarchaeales archaeon]
MVVYVGIIGAGVIGTRLANVFKLFPNIKVVSVCDVNESRASSLASMFERCTVTTDYQRILADPEVHFLYIGVPPSMHRDIAIAAVKAKKNIICEKPLALSYDDCSLMVSAVSSNAVLAAVNIPFRYSLSVSKLKALLHQGIVGTVKKVEIVLRYSQWPRSWQPAQWLIGSFEGGALREVGTHFYFLLIELFGPVSKVLSVVEYPSSGKAEIVAHGIITMASGLTCTVDLIIGTPGKDENTFHVYGTGGRISLVDWFRLILSRDGGDSFETLNEERNNSEKAMIEDFLAILSNPIKNSISRTRLVSFETAANVQ